MTEFEKAQEGPLSDTVEMVLRVARRVKEPYQRQVLERALESIEGEEAPPEGQGEPISRERKYSSQKTIEDTTPPEKIIVDWLLKQNYATKLACVLLSGWHIGDHGTDGIVNDIIDQWSTEILDSINTENLEKLSLEEAFVSGAVVELNVWEDHY